MAPWLMVCVGSIRVASPEWTPASSTCSEMAWEITWPREDFRKSCQAPTSGKLLPLHPVSLHPPTPPHSNRCLEHWPITLQSLWVRQSHKATCMDSPPRCRVTDWPPGAADSGWADLPPSLIRMGTNQENMIAGLSHVDLRTERNLEYLGHTGGIFIFSFQVSV